jgi:organic hydroperoxide reductase OsmC/OhrA
MSKHEATVSWKRETESFAYDDYSRSHGWTFPGGQAVEAASAPDFLGDPSRVDPEEALVAALSSCHMLTFLAIASKKRFVVDSYDDQAEGVMEKNEDGKMAVTRVVLKPKIAFSGDRQPTAEDIERMHHKAHENCFIANSVRTQVDIESR